MDHKAETLTRVVDALEQFNADWEDDSVEFLGAAGSSGFEAATNIIVKKAQIINPFILVILIILAFLNDNK